MINLHKLTKEQSLFYDEFQKDVCLLTPVSKEDHDRIVHYVELVKKKKKSSSTLDDILEDRKNDKELLNALLSWTEETLRYLTAWCDCIDPSAMQNMEKLKLILTKNLKSGE